MTVEQITVLAILGGALVFFAWDRWRFDVVALGALVAGVITGVVPAEAAFEGFSDPVVTTVAAVLIISGSVRYSGALDLAVKHLSPLMRSPTRQVALFAGLVAAFSAFMNNVGALALFLPFAIYSAKRIERPASELLMPLSFGSLLGGLATLIGTPPNLLVASIRRDYTGEAFSMFDFTPVGAGVAVAGVLYLTVAWRLIPKGRRGQPSAEDRFRLEGYISEARVTEASRVAGKPLRDVEALGEGDLSVVGLVRDESRRLVPSGRTVLRAGDVLVLQADPTALKRVVDGAQLDLVANEGVDPDLLRSDEVGVVEAIVMSGSRLVARSLAQLRLRQRFGVNILAVNRPGRALRSRLSRVQFAAGDVIVLQGNLDRMPEVLEALECLPLAERDLQLGRPRQVILPIGILAAAVTVASLGIVPVAIAFLCAVLLIALLRLLTLQQIYDAIDWPVIVLLGAMIPLTRALQDTGGSEVLAGWIAAIAGNAPGPAVLTMILVGTMLVTPVLNNAATVLVMAPIAASLGQRLGINLDPLLMAVAIGASCDFLTPIGHQSNTLVMGPGGYRFGDYARLGLPLSILVVLVAVPLIMLVWPLH